MTTIRTTGALLALLLALAAPCVGAASDVVADIQRDLAALGYDPGPADGVYGPRTGEAIRGYQRDHDLPVDGAPTGALRDHVAATRAAPAARAAPAPAPAVAVERVDPARIAADTELRAAAAAGAPVAAALAAGTEVGLLGYSGPWAEVRTADGREGWVHAARVELVAAGDGSGGAGSDGAGWLRSITGMIGSGRSERSRDRQGVSIGVRGLTPEELRTARAAPKRLEAMERFTAAPGAAATRAAAMGLASRDLPYLEARAAPASAPAPARTMEDAQ